MKKQHLQSDERHRLHRKLLKAATVPGEQIEKVVAAPHLFKAIRAGIGAEKAQREAKRALVGRVNLAAWNWQRFAVSTVAVAVMITLGVLGLFKYSERYYSLPEIAHDNGPEVRPMNVPQPPEPVQDNSESGALQHLLTSRPAPARKVRAEAQRAVKTRPAKTRIPREVEQVSEFYPLTYTGSLEISKENAQIIRVELPRSSLFAMGINVPVENEKDNRVKADLLIGEDGVMRAVRLVN